MYIEKRWLVPATLSLLLLGTLGAVVLLVLGSTVFPASGNVRAAATGTDPNTLVSSQLPPCLNAPANVVPVAAAATVPADAAATSPAAAHRWPTTSPEEVVGISTSGSQNTPQINTRGFGDVGLQFQDVNVNGPITVVHVSNQGNNNANNLNIGEENAALSDQERLRSNRSDGATPVAAASTVASAPEPAAPQPVAASPTPTASASASAGSTGTEAAPDAPSTAAAP